MFKKSSFIVLLLMLVVSFCVHAQQQGGGDDLKGVCELAGGTWTGNEGGNWACCWADWGCYGCYNGVCKMQCRTQRCRDANKMSTAPRGTKSIKALAPEGKMAPIVPIKPKKEKASSDRLN